MFNIIENNSTRGLLMTSIQGSTNLDINQMLFGRLSENELKDKVALLFNPIENITPGDLFQSQDQTTPGNAGSIGSDTRASGLNVDTQNTENYRTRLAELPDETKGLFLQAGRQLVGEAVKMTTSSNYDSTANPIDQIGNEIRNELKTYVATNPRREDQMHAAVDMLTATIDEATGITGDLAKRMEEINALKKEIRTDNKELRGIISEWDDLPKPVLFEYTDANGKKQTEPLNSKEEAEELMNTLDEALQTVGDDAQMQMMYLQQAMDKLQEMETARTNIVKIMHQTLMSIVQNLKAG